VGRSSGSSAACRYDDVSLIAVTDLDTDFPRLGWTARLRARALTGDGLRLVKYTLVSVVSVAVTQVVLLFCYVLVGWSGSTSNIAAVLVGAIPSYVLNRYWAWQKRGRNHLLKEVVPYWALAFLGLVASTVAVDVADDRWGTALAVNAASLFAFGALWLGKFVIFNKVLFVHHPEDLPPALDGRTGVPT